MSASDSFDYVIVGAGSAGCVLAARLSEDPDVRVLLLEAGGRDSNPFIHIPAGYFRTLDNPAVNWRYRSEPEPGTAGREIPFPRGKVLGGSSSINGHVFVRGQAGDYDGWAQLGNRGWSYDDVLPYFQRMENWTGPDHALRGRGGPLQVQEHGERHVLTEAFIAAAEQLGLPRNPDYNAGDQEGVGYFQTVMRDGRRLSTARAYLKPAEARRNLTVETGAAVQRITVDGRRATGVVYRRDGHTMTATAKREVLLSAGTIASPQVLQLSGIGPGAHLTGLGIAVVHDLAGVGRNLQDHYIARVAWRVTQPVTINEQARGLRFLGELARYALFRRGLLSLPAAHVGASVRLAPGAADPDVQMILAPGSYAGGQLGKLEREPGMTCGIWRHRPESRGEVMIRSADPAAPPAIRPNYLSAASDGELTVAAIRFARRLIATPPFDPYRGPEILPGIDIESDADILDYARRNGSTVYHPVGTCRMGPDPHSDAVVDDRLRVHGLDGLRVVDASVMPRLPAANTNAPTIMIAEKAADLIRADA